MNNHELIQAQTNSLLAEINCYLDCLYVTPCPYAKNMLLNLLRHKISFLSFLNFMQCRQTIPAGSQPDQFPQQPGQFPQQTFTGEQLSKYNGRNGQPAYVAVNGVVYDVTNSAAWAAASHFGLTAGKDLTREFANCHQGQREILSSLQMVGRLV